MLDVFIGKVLALRTLRQPHAFAERAVVGFGVCRVQCCDWGAAVDTYGHGYRGEKEVVLVMLWKGDIGGDEK